MMRKRIVGDAVSREDRRGTTLPLEEFDRIPLGRTHSQALNRPGTKRRTRASFGMIGLAELPIFREPGFGLSTFLVVAYLRARAVVRRFDSGDFIMGDERRTPDLTVRQIAAGTGLAPRTVRDIIGIPVMVRLIGEPGAAINFFDCFRLLTEEDACFLELSPSDAPYCPRSTSFVVGQPTNRTRVPGNSDSCWVWGYIKQGRRGLVPRWSLPTLARTKSIVAASVFTYLLAFSPGGNGYIECWAADSTVADAIGLDGVRREERVREALRALRRVGLVTVTYSRTGSRRRVVRVLHEEEVAALRGGAPLPSDGRGRPVQIGGGAGRTTPSRTPPTPSRTPSKCPESAVERVEVLASAAATPDLAHHFRRPDQARVDGVVGVDFRFRSKPEDARVAGVMSGPTASTTTATAEAHGATATPPPPRGVGGEARR